MLKKLLLIILCLFLPINFVFAAPIDELQEIKNILNLPEEKIDIATAMLTIDKILIPSVDINKYLKKIEALVIEIKKQSVDPRGDFLAVQKILYEKGPWNNYKIFSYNLDDPFGKDLNNHLLSHYLDTKLGNCISMPMLYYILMRKLEFEVYMSNAPIHMFVQAQQDDQLFGVETTRNGKSWPLDIYISQWEISEKAVNNHLYFQKLSKKEIIAELLNQAVVYYTRTKQYEKALNVADLALKYMPNNCMVMLNKAIIYLILINDKIYISGIVSSKIKNETKYYMLLKLEYENLNNKVNNLGYRDLSKGEKDEVLERIRRIKEGLEDV